MKLVLTVTQSPADNNITGQTFSIDTAGATIGRGPANNWVLSDGARIISTHHASVAFRQGQFVLTDHSTNGTFVNNGVAPLGQGNSIPLQDNDLIRIGKYELRAGVVAAAPVPGPVATGRNSIPDSFLDELSNKPAKQPAAPPPGPVSPSALDDFDRWLEPQAEAAPARPQWGASNIEYGAAPDVIDSMDPLAAIDQARGGSDPLFPSDIQDDDSGWWKDSKPDNAPAIQQAFQPSPIRNQTPSSTPATAAVFNTEPSFNVESDFNQGSGGFGVAELGLDSGSDIDALLGLAPSEPTSEFEPPPRTPQPNPAWEVQQTTQPRNEQPRNEPPHADFSRADLPRSEPVPVMPTMPTPPVAPVTPRPTSNVSGGDGARQLAELLGLGNMTQEQLDALIPEAASILRESVARLLEGLRARTSIKNEMRLDRTMIQPVENNPLKFALTDKDALRYLFCPDSNAYLPGNRAVREAFDDINDHQMALLAGMRSAYEHMLARFAPSTMESAFGDPQSKWFLGNKKSHLWDAYEQYFVKLQQDPEETFTQLFGRKFSSTYGEQIDEIKARRRKKG